VKPLQRPKWLPEQAWPFQSNSLDIEGSKIAVTDVGQGPVLLFAHTGFWSFIWRDLLLRLKDDFRCVCFDAPGTGQSDRLPVSSISLANAGRALTAVIDALDLDGATLLFHDLAGPSGITGAAKMPERISAMCAINSFAWRPSGSAFRSMLALMGNPAVREFSVWSGLLLRITGSAFGVGLRMDDLSRRVFSAGVDRQAMRAFHGYLHDARRADAIYEELDRALTGPFRKLPLLTIFGERNDPLGFQPRWKQLFPDVRQLLVARGNHFPMCDDPEFVARSIREWHRADVMPVL
jgi:haloalkane dehalogenase